MNDLPQNNMAQTVSEIHITSQLAQRPCRSPDYETENHILAELTQELARNPHNVLQRIVDLIVERCRIGTAGIGLFDSAGTHNSCRWHVAAGALSASLRGTMSHEVSLTGINSARRGVLLFPGAESTFPVLRGTEPRIHENLLAPWEVNGKVSGMLWAVSHQADRRFDAEDARMIGNLARFAAAAYSIAERMRTGDELRAERAAALNLMEDAVIARQEFEQASAALRENEERMRRALSIETVGVLFFNLNGTILDANAAFERMSGYTVEELRATEHWESLTPSEFRSDTAVAAEELATLGETAPYEKQLIRKDGSRWWGLFAPKRLSDSGRNSECVEFIVDITERKRTEEALRSSEEQLRAALQAAEMATWDYNVRSSRVVWNEQHFILFGLAPDGKEKPVEEFLRFIHPEDLALVRERMRMAIEESGVYRADFRIIRADNKEVRWMRGYGNVIEREDGKATRLTGVMFDVNEQRLAEEKLAVAQERLRLILENAREYAIFSLDLERRVVSWNPGAERLLGYSEAEIIGQAGDIIFTEEDRAHGAPAQEAKQALTEGRAGDERWHVRKNGMRFWANGVAMPMYNREGETIGLLKILRDETDARAAKDAIERSRHELWMALQEAEVARAEAEAAGRAKDHFLAVLSHELRTPLNPVLIATRMLTRRKDLSPALAETMEMIQRNIKIEAQLIDELLDLTRVARGKMELHREPMDLHTAVWHAVQVTDPDIQSKKQQLVIRLDASQSQVFGDTTRLQQVFWNLLKNAAKFTPVGGEIHLSSRSEPGRIMVEVHDTGIGFEPEAAGRIFDAFEQASASVTREFGGLGLGLAISKASIDAHEGELRAWSAGRNQGATFTVSLPLYVESDSVIAGEPPMEVPPEGHDSTEISRDKV